MRCKRSPPRSTAASPATGEPGEAVSPAAPRLPGSVLPNQVTNYAVERAAFGRISAPPSSAGKPPNPAQPPSSSLGTPILYRGQMLRHHDRSSPRSDPERPFRVGLSDSERHFASGALRRHRAKAVPLVLRLIAFKAICSSIVRVYSNRFPSPFNSISESGIESA